MSGQGGLGVIPGVVPGVVVGVARGWFRGWSRGGVSLCQVDEDLVRSSVPPF